VAVASLNFIHHFEVGWVGGKLMPEKERARKRAPNGLKKKWRGSRVGLPDVYNISQVGVKCTPHNG
jgi:hypothetical protein